MALLRERIDKLVKRETQLLEHGLAALGGSNQTNDWPEERDMEFETQSSPPNGEPSDDASEQQLAALLESENWLTNGGFVDETSLSHQV